MALYEFLIKETLVILIAASILGIAIMALNLHAKKYFSGMLKDLYDRQAILFIITIAGYFIHTAGLLFIPKIGFDNVMVILAGVHIVILSAFVLAFVFAYKNIKLAEEIGFK